MSFDSEWSNQPVLSPLVIVVSNSPKSGFFVYTGTPANGNPPLLAITTQATDPYGNAVTANAITDRGMPLLVYSGVPALGNLIASLAPVATTDDVGNAVPQGINVTTGQISGTTITSDQGSYKLVMTSGTLSFQAPSFTESGVAQVLFPGNNASSPQLELASPSSNSTGKYTAALFLNGESQDGTAGPSAILTGVTPTSNRALTSFLVNGQIIAVDPTSTLSPETWHTMTLTAGWGSGNNVLTGASDPPSYRLNPDLTVSLRGALITPSTGTVTGVAFAVLPSGYRNTQPTPPTAALVQNNFGHGGGVGLFASGNLELWGNWTNSENLQIDCTLARV